MVLEKKDVDNIREAIVRQAAEDYLLYKKRLYKLDRGLIRIKDSKQVTERDLDRVIDFFYSEWFMMLCPYDPNAIFDQLDSQFDEWVVEMEANGGVAKSA